MAQTPTTRMGLLEVRSRLQIAGKGATLLRSKREVLAGEFFRLMKDVLKGRQKLDEALRTAGRSLTLARAQEGEPALESLALSAARPVSIAVKQRRLWGVAVPEVTAPRLVRASDARGASPVSWGLGSADAARRHEEALEILLGVASREFHLRRLGEEIRETSRRINALEQLLLPRMEAEAARIEMALDERAREDAVRLKRFRGRRTGSGRPG
jgi:V/A-type H+-transporting ATPase subunit D